MSVFDDLFRTRFYRRSIWNRGQAIEGYDPADWRLDDEGNMIRYSDYGDRDSAHGWGIDVRPLKLRAGEVRR